MRVVGLFYDYLGEQTVKDPGKNYGILEKLDTMSGRYVDNAGFFALDDFKKVSNEELYARLLEEFPSWLEEIKRKGMI